MNIKKLAHSVISFEKNVDVLYTNILIFSKELYRSYNAANCSNDGAK